MRLFRGVRKRVHDDEGTALTEFAIVAPLFIILIYWSQFFADLGMLKLKAEEAARYATWEMTAHRSPGVVSSEVRTRFADLSSPEEYQGNRPEGALSWNDVGITVRIQDQIDAPFRGKITLPSLGMGGFIDDMMEGIGKFLGKAADWVVKQMKFKTEGRARAEVEFSVENKLFPGGSLLGIFFDSPEPPRLTVRANSPTLLWNTWKAWPGKSLGGSVETDVYDTYPRVNSRASVPEKLVYERINRMSFFGIGHHLAKAGPVFDFLNLPNMFGSETWKDNNGPTTMLPGALQTKSWQPGYMTPLQRIGNDRNSDSKWARTTTTTLAPKGSQDEGTDRQRFTTPSHVKSVMWKNKDDNGRSVVKGSLPMVPDGQNPYVRMYRCRDAFYMGSKRGELQHYNQPTWARRAHPGC